MNTKTFVSNRQRKHRRQLVSAGVALLLVLPLGAQAGGVVTTCTEAALRAAMAGGGTATFACDGTITLASTITNATNIVLDGTGHQVTISGQNAIRVFWVGTNATLTLINLTIANGADYGGAGVLNAGGAVNATNCTFSGNTASASGGAILNNGGLLQLVACNFAGNQASASGFEGGAICNSGTGIVDLCTFTGNVVSGANGSIGFGGAICNDYTGTLVIRRSAFVGNGATGGEGKPGLDVPSDGGPGHGGAIWNSGTLSLDSSMTKNNSATGGQGGTGHIGGVWMYEYGTDGGPGGNGGRGEGGALWNFGLATVVNCTFAEDFVTGGTGGAGGTGGTGTRGNGNGGAGGAGGDGFGGICSCGQLRMTNCTEAYSRAYSGQGGAGGAGGGSGTPNPGYRGPGGSGGVAYDGGFITGSDSFLVNILTALNGGSFPDPKLGPLADNGGPTRTMALLPGSPAIDAGTAIGAPPTDQRGVPRPQGAGVDLGAFEYQYAIPVISRAAFQGPDCWLQCCGLPGSAYTVQLSTNLLNWSDLNSFISGTNGLFDYVDAAQTNCAKRFYRLTYTAP